MSMLTDEGWFHMELNGMMISYPPSWFSPEAIAEREAAREAERKADEERWAAESARRSRRNSILFWTWMIGWNVYFILHYFVYNGLI